MPESRTVIRTVQTPEELDQALRVIAFQLRGSKSELIIQLLLEGLQSASGSDDPVGLIFNMAKGDASPVEQDQFARLLDHMRPLMTPKA